MQNGGLEEDVRSQLLVNVKDSTTYSTTTYSSPKLGDGNKIFALSEIKAYPYGVFYNYIFANTTQKSLTIWFYVDPAYMRFARINMEDSYREIGQPDKRVYDLYGETKINEITYYYYHYPKNDSTTIYWKIDDSYYSAWYYGDYANIQEVLPLLEIEQVGYQVSNSGAVKE